LVQFGEPFAQAYLDRAFDAYDKCLARAVIGGGEVGPVEDSGGERSEHLLDEHSLCASRIRGFCPHSSCPGVVSDVSSVSSAAASECRGNFDASVRSDTSSQASRRAYRSVRTTKSPGYCYLKIVSSEKRPLLAATLGSYPTLEKILQQKAEVFNLDGIKASRVSRDIVHLGRFSKSGISVRTALVDVVGRGGVAFASGSLGHQLSGFVASTVSGMSLRDKVGAGVLQKWLSSVEVGDMPLDTVELISSSAALLPESGKRRLRSLEALGDAAISTCIAQDNYFRGESAQRYQDLRSRVTSNKVLAEVFCSSVPEGAVKFVGSVNPNTGVVGAKALESIFGAVWLHYGAEGVSKLLNHLGLLDFPLEVSASSITT